MSLPSTGHVVVESGRHDEVFDNQVPVESPDEFVGRAAIFWFRVQQTLVGVPDQLVVKLDGLGDLGHRVGFGWLLSDVSLDAAMAVERCWGGIVVTSTARHPNLRVAPCPFDW